MTAPHANGTAAAVRQHAYTPASTAHPAPRPDGDEISLLQLVTVLLRQRRLLVGLPLLVAAATFIVCSVLPPVYTARTAFTPQAVDGSGGASMAGIAAQFGFSLPGAGGADRTPEFYVDLLRSQTALLAIANARYEAGAGGRAGGHAGTLAEIYGVEAPTKEERQKLTLDELRDNLVIAAGKKTGVVQVSVHARDGQLARQIAARVLAVVDDYNLTSRRARAAAERGFLQERLDEKRAELRAAERQLTAFLQANREFRGDPYLLTEFDRMQRDVSLRQQVFLALAQGYEQAGLDAVRNTPQIMVVEQPTIPLVPDPAQRVVRSAMAFILGLFVALAVAFVRESARRQGEREPEAFAELARARADAAGDLRVLGGTLLPRFRGGRGRPG